MSVLRRGIDQTDWTKGPPDAPVTLLEYGDFQCPYCGAAHMHLKRLEAEAGNEFRFTFRHFPLTQMHPDAMLAAEAAEAAGAQGKFWQMHDLLFEHQDRLDPHSLLSPTPGPSGSILGSSRATSSRTGTPRRSAAISWRA